MRHKAVAVIQSAPGSRRPQRKSHAFTICVLGHLRYEKDPLRAAYAVRGIDRSLDVRVVQAGQILVPRYEPAVRREMQRNSRYRYAGALSRGAALRLLGRSDLLVQSSRIEGGANTICEAITAGVPIVASRISGNIGILGRSYPGLYRTADTDALRDLLERAAGSSAFYEKLRSATEKLRPLVTEDREKNAWRTILQAC